MQLTPEQINTLINGILIIISGVVGGIITILGGVITTSFQRNQERVKLRKEIFEARFTQVEAYTSEIMVSCRKLSNGLQQNSHKDQVIKELEGILDLAANIYILAGLRVSKDEDIFTAIQNFSGVLIGFVKNINIYLLSHDNNELKNVVLQILSLLEQAYVYLKESVDNFRLNEYEPVHKYDIDKDKINQ